MSSPKLFSMDEVNEQTPDRKTNKMVSEHSNSLKNSTGSYETFYNQVGCQQGIMYSTPTNPIEPITQNICNTLHTIKEKPKIYQKNVFKEIVPDVEDHTLPKDLTALFQPLFCKLCKAQLSSNVMAKLHYKSKNHEKKIRKYLFEHSQKTGEPLHKRARLTGTPKSDEEQNPRWFHCDVCDLPLTGKMHAESHYMGKNHQKAMMGYKPPAGKGFYNSEGKWVRTASNKNQPNLDGYNDNFGLDFRRKELSSTTTKSNCSSESTNPSTSLAADSQQRFHCAVCDVAATCQEQIDMHFKGQKHSKKLKQLGLAGNVTSGDIKINIPKAAIIDKGSDINLSVYRTPSGDFYCLICNLTLNSEPQFKTHLKSKGHMKKASQKL